jgi:hypothetical protein
MARDLIDAKAPKTPRRNQVLGRIEQPLFGMDAIFFQANPPQ